MPRLVIAAALAATFALAGVASALTTEPCPPGDRGIAVSHGSRTLAACTNI
jgi:hypothetical protein